MTAPFTSAAERDVWVHAFHGDAETATVFRPHFTDPHLAEQWSNCWVGPQTAAVLHGHGATPDIEWFRQTYMDAFTETSGDDRFPQTDLRTAVLALHPHLTRTDRDTIAAAGLTLPEVTTLITTGTYDPDALALLGGLR